MIYLIEDKTSRRVDYGWSDGRIDEYSDVLTVVENVEDFCSIILQQNLEDNDVLLYHESFLNGASLHKNSIKQFLKTAEDNCVNIAYFSGSKSSRTLDDNVCNLHPSVLYSNLEEFLFQYKDGNIDFRYLMFGKHIEKEYQLRESLSQQFIGLIGKEKVPTTKNVFFALSSEGTLRLEVPFANVIEDDTLDYNSTDKEMIQYVDSVINANLYDMIYIPLCYGDTLSDFLGLRIAMFIRFSNSANKYAPICIYGNVNCLDLVNNECFDVLKMSQVYLIPGDRESIINVEKEAHPISKVDYQLDLQNIKLNVPTDIGDNHCVTNQWGIYRWSYALEDTDDDIEKVRAKIDSSLYFRYLSAIYPSSQIKKIRNENLKISKSKDLPPLNVLYVDDEADRGWYELLCEIIYSVNDVQFDYLGDDLCMKSQDEILNMTMDKINETNPNVVILDFRLHGSDFSCNKIEDISGYKLLKRIKEYNRGIQVLVFSATNKVWNLQMLEQAGADGFIVKESPINSMDPLFTSSTINHFVEKLSDCAQNTYKIHIWERIQFQKEKLKQLRNQHKFNKEYVDAVLTLLSMTEDILFAKNIKYPYGAAFMHLFRIIEATANEWIEETPVPDNVDHPSYYYFKFRSDDSQLLDFPTREFTPNPTNKLFVSKKTLPYYQKICNTLNKVGAFSTIAYDIVQKRNEFTHPNLIKNNELASFAAKDVIDMFGIVNTLISNIENI